MVVCVVGDYADAAVDEAVEGCCGEALALEKREWVRGVGEVVSCVEDVAEENAAGGACEVGAGAGREVVEDLGLHWCGLVVVMVGLDGSVRGGAVDRHILSWGVGGDVPNRGWRVGDGPRWAVIGRLRVMVWSIPLVWVHGGQGQQLNENNELSHWQNKENRGLFAGPYYLYFLFEVTHAIGEHWSIRVQVIDIVSSTRESGCCLKNRNYADDSDSRKCIDRLDEKFLYSRDLSIV